MGDFIEIAVGGGRRLRIYAVPSGWHYETGASKAVMGNIGPFGGGHITGTIVVRANQGRHARATRYRLQFHGIGLSVSKGEGPPLGVSEQASTEDMWSQGVGQIYRLPRSHAPMGEAQEAGSPTGLAGQFLLLSYDRAAGFGKSTSIMLLGGDNALVRSRSADNYLVYKYAMMFNSTFMGSFSGLSGSSFAGTVSMPVIA